MPIESISLQDFQAHAKREIELSPRITVLTGATDAGKSSIIRALRWACLNDLSGDEFVREGAKRASVTVIVDGKEIVREKGGAHNVYELDGNPFKSFQTSVPEDIARALNVSEINFQSQHDSPFWFNETAGEVSRRLNAIIDLSVIDTTLATIASELRKAQEREELTAERLSRAEKSLEEMEAQCQRAQEFAKLDEADENLFRADKAVNSLEGLLTAIRGNQASRLGQRAHDAEAVLESARKLLDAEETIRGLGDLIYDLAALQRQASPPPDFSPVAGKFKEWLAACDDFVDLEDALYATQLAVKKLREAKEHLASAEKDFYQQTKNVACPVCQKRM